MRGRARPAAALRAAVDVAAAVSAFNAAELREAGARDVRVVPILFDPARLGRAARAAPAATGRSC